PGRLGRRSGPASRRRAPPPRGVHRRTRASSGRVRGDVRLPCPLALGGSRSVARRVLPGGPPTFSLFRAPAAMILERGGAGPGRGGGVATKGGGGGPRAPGGGLFGFAPAPFALLEGPAGRAPAFHLHATRRPRRNPTSGETPQGPPPPPAPPCLHPHRA